MPRHRKKPRALLDYDTIAAASTGDPDAMAEVLRHFDGFISKLATRTFRDANNVSFSGVDQEMKERMQLKAHRQHHQELRSNPQVTRPAALGMGVLPPFRAHTPPTYADTLSISASPVCNENCTIFVTNRIFDRQVEKTKGTHLHFVMKTI